MNRCFAICLTLISTLVLLSGPPARAAVTLTDMAGNTAVLKQPAQRIVTTFKPATLCLLSLGLADRLVGVDTPSKKGPLQLAVHPAIKDLPGVGRKAAGLNFETIVALKPDLVILYAQMDGPGTGKRLNAVGIPAITIVPETFATIQESLKLMARAAGCPERADAVAQAMDDLTDLVQNRLAALPEAQRKTAYFASSLGIFNTTTANMIQHEIMTLAGVTNVSAGLTGYFQDVSQEQLIRWNPDLILTSKYLSQGQLHYLDNKALQRIKAVAGHQIYRCPASLAPWDFPSPLTVLAGLWLAQTAYPEYFADIDFSERVDVYHELLFGKSLTEMGGTLNDKVVMP